MFELVDSCHENAVIKVIGVGGGGGNAIEYMVNSNIEGVEFVCANTDAQALKNSSAKSVIQLGNGVTKGLGAGANPEIGRQAALEDKERIQEAIAGADMVFIAAGMGGGTGTGGAPVVAEIAKELGILTVAVVTKPFPFEMRKRMQIAEQGIEQLRQSVDSLIVVPNDKLLRILKGAKLLDAFKAANEILSGAVQGIAELITRPGLINVDFADVRTVMSEHGMAMMGSGAAGGDQRARQAAEYAIASPLLEDVDLSGAKGILVNITAGSDIGIDEFAEVGAVVENFASEEATVVVGTAIDNELGDELRVTVVATGFGNRHDQKNMRVVPQSARMQRRVEYAKNIEQPSLVKKQAIPTSTAIEETAPTTSNMPNNKSTVAHKQNAQQQAGSDIDYLDIPAFLRRQAD